MAFYVRAFGEGNTDSFEHYTDTQGFVTLRGDERIVEEIDLQVTNTVMGSMSLQCISNKGCTIDIYYSNWKKLPAEASNIFVDLDPDKINTDPRLGGGMVFKMPESIVVPPQSKMHKMISVPISRYVWVVIKNTDENEVENPTLGHILFV